MADPTPAAAAPAATPAAAAAPTPAPAPAAPAAPAPAPTTVSTPGAPAAAGGPVSAEPSLLDVAAPAAPAAPQTEAEKLAAAQALVDASRAAADPNNPAAWVLAEGVLGKGERPSWFKADKYATVAKQAEAYTALEQRFGAFVGAPKDAAGNVKYEWKPPENAPEAVKAAKFDMENPLFKGFNEWAARAQLSQEGYSQVLGMLAQYEANNAPNPAANKAAIGADADTRITAVSNWAKANLEAPEQAALWDSMRGKNAPVVFKAIEAMIKRTSQFRMPKPGEDTAAPGAGGLAEIEALAAAKDANGKRLADVDPKYRAMLFQKRTEYFRANPVPRDRMGNLRG